MINKAFLGLPINFHDICTIYPPLIGEVIENSFINLFIKELTTTQTEIDYIFLIQNKNDIDIKNIPSPFDLLLSKCFTDKKYETIIKEAFKFFIRNDITFLYDQKKILIGDLEKIITNTKNIEDLQMLKYITEDNFFDFQNHIRIASGLSAEEEFDYTRHKKVREFKAKSYYRDLIKNKQNKINFSDMLESICCMNIGINPLNIDKITLAAFTRLNKRGKYKDMYNSAVPAAMFGGGLSELTHWTENLDE